MRRCDVDRPRCEREDSAHKGCTGEALKPLGLERELITMVGGFATALALARASDLITTVPERHTGNLSAGTPRFFDSRKIRRRLK
jgi:hypothetical protein